jgi:hypothetical protein
MYESELISKWKIKVPLEHGPGWFGVLDTILSAMEAAGFDKQRDEITQIKEKFGCIRVYVNFDQSIAGGSERLEQVRKAMLGADKSAKTCEICGEPSKMMVTHGWWMTRCLEHKSEGSKSLREHFNRV